MDQIGNSVQQCDVAVVGGGLSGICAALAAAGLRKRVLLVEKYGFLGGLTTSAFRVPWTFSGTSTFSGLGAAGKEVLEALSAAGGMKWRGQICTVDTELLKFVLQEVLLRNGVELLLHSQCGSIVKDGDRIQTLEAYCREGKIRIVASAFVDATGQSILAGWSGLPLDTVPSHSSYRFMMTNVHGMKISGEQQKRLAARWHSLHPELHPGPFLLEPGIRDGEVIVGIIHIGWSGELTPDSTSALEVRCPLLVADAEEFLRKEVDAFRKASVLAVPAQTGVPSARRIHGHPEITEMPAADKADAGMYDRSICIQGVANLFLAGREILSAALYPSVHNPQAGMILGERAGVLAATSLS